MKKRYINWIAVLLLSAMVLGACGKEEVPQTDPIVSESGNTEASGTEKVPTEQVESPVTPSVDPPIDPPVDPPIIDPDAVEQISSAGSGYGDILRVKSTGEILFSPIIKELRELTDIGEELNEYQIELLFILLDESGNEYYAYPKLTLPIRTSKGDWFDVFLQGEDIDCGFCPTAARVYTIEVGILKEERIVMAGTWQSVKASEDYSESEYYAPTAIPTEDEVQKVDCTVEYKVQGTGGTLLGESKQMLKAGQASSKVTAVAEKGYMFSGWSDGYPNAEREGDTFIRDKVIYAKFTKSELDPGIPNMYIQTDTGTPINTKEYMNATIRIVGALEDKYNISVTTEIRGRGNSSFNGSASQDSYDSKNSYRIKLTEKENLLGVGGSSNRDWVLNSNKFDASNLRNYFVWNLANQMQTLPFVPGCTWVNLYINGDYRGIYMLTDLVEAANDRVEVDDSSSDPDKGYLVELDFRGADETDVVEGLHYFYVPGFYDQTSGISNPREWVIKSDVTSTAETDFIRDYIIRCHNAILSGDRDEIDALVDIPSLIDMFIIEELSKDVDAGGASIFMQKDKGGKLYFTAPWDFDFGFGTYGAAINTSGFVCENDHYTPHIWFGALLQQKWFLTEVQARMQQLNEMIETAKQGVKATAEVLLPAADRNDERWGIYGERFHQYVSSQVSGRLYSYDEHITFLCDWIDERWTWMTDEIAYRLQ